MFLSISSFLEQSPAFPLWPPCELEVIFARQSSLIRVCPYCFNFCEEVGWCYSLVIRPPDAAGVCSLCGVLLTVPWGSVPVYAPVGANSCCLNDSCFSAVLALPSPPLPHQELPRVSALLAAGGCWLRAPSAPRHQQQPARG